MASRKHPSLIPDDDDNSSVLVEENPSNSSSSVSANSSSLRSLREENPSSHSGTRTSSSSGRTLRRDNDLETTLEKKFKSVQIKMLEEMEAMRSSNIDQIDKNATDIAGIQTSLLDVYRYFGDLKGNCDQLSDEVKKKTKTIQELEEKSESIMTQLDEKAMNIQELEEKSVSIMTQLDEKAMNIQELEEKSVSIMTQLDEKAMNIQELEEKSEAMKTQLDDRDTKLEDMAKKIAKLRNDCRELKENQEQQHQRHKQLEQQLYSQQRILQQQQHKREMEQDKTLEHQKPFPDPFPELNSKTNFYASFTHLLLPRLQTGTSVRMMGYGNLVTPNDAMDLQTGIYTTPCSGQFDFNVTAKLTGMGSALVFICKNGRKEPVATLTDGVRGWKSGAVKWQCGYEESVWVEIERLDGEAEVVGCDFSGALLQD